MSRSFKSAIIKLGQIWKHKFNKDKRLIALLEGSITYDVINDASPTKIGSYWDFIVYSEARFVDILIRLLKSCYSYSYYILIWLIASAA